MFCFKEIFLLLFKYIKYNKNVVKNVIIKYTLFVKPYGDIKLKLT